MSKLWEKTRYLSLAVGKFLKRRCIPSNSVICTCVLYHRVITYDLRIAYITCRPHFVVHLPADAVGDFSGVRTPPRNTDGILENSIPYFRPSNRTGPCTRAINKLSQKLSSAGLSILQTSADCYIHPVLLFPPVSLWHHLKLGQLTVNCTQSELFSGAYLTAPILLLLRGP